MRNLFGFSMAATFIVAAGCGKKPSDTGSGPTAPASIDGTYLIVGLEMGGEKMPDEMVTKGPIEERTFVIKGDKMTTKKRGKDDISTIKFDATKSPAQIDMTETNEMGKSETMYGIYKLEGDTLTICAQMEDDGKAENRPKEFKSSDKYVIMTLKKK